ncbi:Peptide deformylase [Candidatus Hydrogenisulfobacillus filiaventi]|uniref:Peptide deformylase n=1 Tax=Candidatus Hydrogenisulfobacillus filiaventi TaxID=2707344 RepID=A0A6F8ZJ39_9FIRM|nr:peptide deformylase [Bacillota bacterium]CAB1129745.1 Peptide deformylase [Candidatus Hydrogenisulfobacillus filiaventi]
MIQPIWTIPASSAFLRQRTTKVHSINQEVRQVAADLRDTWPTVSAYGIAAPQIGSRRRMFAYRHADREDEPPIILINPKIIRARGELKDYDGCLSVPGIYGETRRAAEIEVLALNERGEPVRLTFEGFDARIIQHEVDHLEGVLFIDRVDDLDEFYTLETQEAVPEGEEGRYRRVPLTPEQREFIARERRPLPAYALTW